jgi:hypothetical protein
VIYTVTLLGLGAGTTVWLARTMWRSRGRREPVVGITGVVAWIAGEALLLAGIGALVAVGVTHADNVDIGAVWAGAAVLLAAMAAEAAKRPVSAARHLARSATFLTAATAAMTLVTFFVDRTEFDRTSIGPFVQSVAFGAVPALVAAAFLRLAGGPAAREVLPSHQVGTFAPADGTATGGTCGCTQGEGGHRGQSGNRRRSPTAVGRSHRVGTAP